MRNRLMISGILVLCQVDGGDDLLVMPADSASLVNLGRFACIIVAMLPCHVF